MKVDNIFIRSLISILLLAGCTQEMDLTPFSGYPVCVFCVLTNDEVQNLELVYARPLFETEFQPVTEASVTLQRIDGDNKQNVGSFTRNADTERWQLDYTPIANAKYRLEINVPGRDLVYAELTYHPQISISTKYVPGYEDNVAVEDSLDPSNRGYDLSENQKYYDAVHSKGLKDMSETMPGILFKVETSQTVSLMMKSDYISSWQTSLFYCDLPTVVNINKVSKVSISENSYFTEDNYGGRSSILWTKSLDGYPLWKDFILFDISPDFSNSLSKPHTLLFDAQGYPKYRGSCEIWPECFNVFRIIPIMYGSIIYPSSVRYRYMISHGGSVSRYSFYCITDELKEYLIDAWPKFYAPRKEETDILKKLYAGEDVYSNIHGGYGIFGAYYKTKASQMQ